MEKDMSYSMEEKKGPFCAYLHMGKKGKSLIFYAMSKEGCPLTHPQDISNFFWQYALTVELQQRSMWKLKKGRKKW